MSRMDFYVSRWPLLVVFAAVVLSSSGCVGIAAQIMYMIKGIQIEAEFKGLKEKKVAVVCVSKASAYGNGAEAEQIARMVAVLLQKEVKKIEIIPYAEVDKWMDNNDWDFIDYRAVGKGVEAEMLVAIDLNSISYYDGQTLYKGRANYKLTVYDIKQGGKVAYSESNNEFEYPLHGGRPATDMTELAFKKAFLTIVAEDIARTFYPYDAATTYGSDARGIE